MDQIKPDLLLDNQLFFNKGSEKEFSELLSKGRAKQGMFEGDLEEGELEIGQVSGIINEIMPAKQIVENLITEYKKAIQAMNEPKYIF